MRILRIVTLCVIIVCALYLGYRKAFPTDRTSVKYGNARFIGSRESPIFSRNPFVIRDLDLRSNVDIREVVIALSNRTVVFADVDVTSLQESGWLCTSSSMLGMTHCRISDTWGKCYITFTDGVPSGLLVTTEPAHQIPGLLRITGIPGTTGESIALPIIREDLIEVFGTPDRITEGKQL